MIRKLSDKQGEFLLEIAKKTIHEKLDLAFKTKTNLENILNKEALYEKQGTFVTLHKNGDLRGCIGTLQPNESIIDGIKGNAINAAFKDPRFTPVKQDEINKIDIEISILTKPEKLKYKGADDLLLKLKPKTDGVIIHKNYHKATFLPQVWDQLSDKKDFLSHICIKAGLPSNEWEYGELEVFTYQVQYFKEK